MNFNFNQALADKGRRQDEELRQEWQKINDNYELGMLNALKPSGGNSSTAKPEPVTPYSKIGNIASVAAKSGYDAAYNPPISNPSIGVYGDSTSILDQKPRLKEGGIIDSIKGILGVRKPAAQNNDQAKDANRVANHTGGMVGGAAKALQSRQLRIEEELKRQGLRKGTTRVIDKTGKGSPTKDTVDAKLAEGEAVLNAGAAKILGRKSIADLNAQGLQAMGMQGAKPEVKGGKVHAVAGYGPDEEKRVLQSLGMNPVAAAAPIAGAIGSIGDMVRKPIGTASAQSLPKATIPVAEKQTIATMTPGDAMRLRRPAEPQYSQQVAVPANYKPPVDRAEQSKQLDNMSEAYRNAPVNKRTVDMSNADFAAQGMGDIAKIVKNGKTEYTNIGNRNKFNNEEAQARTVGYKAQEKARADSVAQQLATPADVEKLAGQFALGQSRKIADLQDQYVAAPDPTQRATLADNIGMMTGKDKQPAKRREIVSATRKTKDPDGNEETVSDLYDPETRQWIEQPSSLANAGQINAYKTEAEARKAGQRDGDRVIINGVQGTLKKG